MMLMLTPSQPISSSFRYTTSYLPFLIKKTKSLQKPITRRRVSKDFIRTNVMADYLDKMSTDIYHISQIEEDETEAWIQLAIIIIILIYMFVSGNKDSDKDTPEILD